VACFSPCVAPVEFVVARFAAMATMVSAAAFSSALGLVFAAMLPVALLHLAASSMPLFAVSVQV